MLSSFARKDVTVLGKFTLNLTNIPTVEDDDEKKNEQEKTKTAGPKNFSECFFEAIKKLVPTVYTRTHT